MKIRHLLSFILLAIAAAPLGAQALVSDAPQKARATYRVTFVQDKYDIRPEYMDNAEQIRRMRTNLYEALTSPGFVLDTIAVTATASPEGSWAHNMMLSENRGRAVAGYIQDYLMMSGLSGAGNVRYVVRNVPENWEGLDRLMREDPMINSYERSLYFSREYEYDRDRREAAMRGDSYYKMIYERFYPLLRVVELTFIGHGTNAPQLNREKIDTVYIDRPVEVVREVEKIVEVPVAPAEPERYRWAISTNITKWAFLGTMNMGVHFPVANRVSADLFGRYNPWTFNKESVDRRMTWRERTIAAGLTFYANRCFETGFYLGAGVQYMQFNRGGVFSDKVYEGYAYGAYLKLGYLVSINDHWKFAAGLGAFGGYADYNVYTCNVCGRKIDAAKGWRIAPDTVNLSIVYVF